MKNMMRTFLALIMIGGFTVSSLAQEPAKKSKTKMEMPEPSKDQRAKMAHTHEQMAACLRSDKNMKDCQEEMRKTCMEMGDQCPMMMEHHGMGKMKHGHDKD